jgi:hypothetical protein
MTDAKLTWEADLEKSSTKYHTYGAWIAVIFDPIFGITDYLNIPHAFIKSCCCELVKDIFKCEYRGDIEVKGKGPMKMYFVLE